MSAGLNQKPFLFDTSFDGAGGELVMEPPGGEPPAPQFGEEDLERACRPRKRWSGPSRK